MEPRETLVMKKLKSSDSQALNTEQPTIILDDNYDILVEVLKHLDARSLGVAACVSKLWNTICSMESLWEHLCNRHCTTESSPASAADVHIRSVVLAMGGYRRLYLLCIRPLLARLASPQGSESGWTKDQVQLSLSLFSIDCYERLGNKLGDCSSLMFLYKTSPATQNGDGGPVCCVAPANLNRNGGP